MSSILSIFRRYSCSVDHIKDPLYKNSIFIVFSSVFNIGCGFLFWMIAARTYSVEEVGLSTALISSLGLIILFSRLGFDFSIIRFYPIEDKAKIFNTSLAITTIATFIIGSVYIMLVNFFAPNLAFLNEFTYVLIFLLIGIVNSVASITGNALIADRKANLFFYQNIFLAFRIVLLIPLLSLKTLGILGSVGIAYCVASFFSLIIIRKSLLTITPKINIDFIRKSFRFSFWNYASNILSSAPTLILPIMILNILGEAEAAKYYIAFHIGNLVLIIPSSLGTSLFVEGSHGEGLKKNAKRAIYGSLVLMVPVVLLLLAFGDRLLQMLKGEYVEAFDLLRLLAISSFLVISYSIFIPIQNIRMKIESAVKLNALRCILLLSLSYYFLNQYGIMGAGYAWIITYSIIFILIAVILKDYMH